MNVALVRQTILEFIQSEKQFTAIDIANTLRARFNYFIPYGLISKTCRIEVIDLAHSLKKSYSAIQIGVNDNKFLAPLYTPFWKDSADYTGRNQELIPIKEMILPQPRDSKGRFTSVQGD